jgi:hypothetical protein
MIRVFKHFKVIVNGRFKTNSPNIYLSINIGRETRHEFHTVTPDCGLSIDLELTLFYEPLSNHSASTDRGRSIKTHIEALLCLVLCLYRGGFPQAPQPYMVYCTSPIDIQTAAMRTHRASPLVPPTREQWN